MLAALATVLSFVVLIQVYFYWTAFEVFTENWISNIKIVTLQTNSTALLQADNGETDTLPTENEGVLNALCHSKTIGKEKLFSNLVDVRIKVYVFVTYATGQLLCLTRDVVNILIYGEDQGTTVVSCVSCFRQNKLSENINAKH